VTKAEIIKEIIENPDYKPNLYEILNRYFDRCPLSYNDWKRWFNVQDNKTAEQ